MPKSGRTGESEQHGAEVFPPPALLRSGTPRVPRHDDRPMLLWCMLQQVGRSPAAEALERRVRHQRILHFPTPVKFTRWLFQQRRGDISPWAVLAVGWREAKPCMVAIRAAISGDEASLRPDARRPELRPTPASGSGRGGEGARLGYAGIAVGAMVIMAERPEQERRALAWAEAEEGREPRLQVSVARDFERLQATLDAFDQAASSSSVGAPAAAPAAVAPAAALTEVSPEGPPRNAEAKDSAPRDPPAAGQLASPPGPSKDAPAALHLGPPPAMLPWRASANGANASEPSATWQRMRTPSPEYSYVAPPLMGPTLSGSESPGRLGRATGTLQLAEQTISGMQSTSAFGLPLDRPPAGDPSWC